MKNVRFQILQDGLKVTLNVCAEEATYQFTKETLHFGFRESRWNCVRTETICNHESCIDAVMSRREHVMSRTDDGAWVVLGRAAGVLSKGRSFATRHLQVRSTISGQSILCYPVEAGEESEECCDDKAEVECKEESGTYRCRSYEVLTQIIPFQL